MQLLVQKKANVTAQNRAGKTAAELAKDDATKQLLLQVGGTQSMSHDKSGTFDVQAEMEDVLLRRQRSSRHRRQQINRLLRKTWLLQRCQQHQMCRQKEGTSALHGSQWRPVPMQHRTKLTVQQVLPQRQMGGASGSTRGKQARTSQKWQQQVSPWAQRPRLGLKSGLQNQPRRNRRRRLRFCRILAMTRMMSDQDMPKVHTGDQRRHTRY